MNLLKEIRERFAELRRGALPISSLSLDYPAWVMRIDEGYGIAVPVPESTLVSEHFAGCHLYTKTLVLGAYSGNLLILANYDPHLRYEFAAVCAQFVDPGSDGAWRRNLIESPSDWWKKWKELMGNSSLEKSSYSVIAEMRVLLYLFRLHHNVVWSAVGAGSHDIEGTESGAEVKSTIKRYGATITISSQHQLQHEKPLELYFLRMEKSLEGTSINNMVEELCEAGYERGKLENQLEKLGFEKGASIRDEKYKVLEQRKYEINDEFPQIIPSSFKNGRIPSAITHITYTVDLDGIDYTIW